MDQRRNLSFIAGLAALTLLAALLRLAGAGGDTAWTGLPGCPLWHDEASTALIVKQDLPALVRSLARLPRPPLHYLATWAATGAVGRTEFGLRLVSLLAAIAFVPLIGWGARRLFTPAVGLWAAFLAASAPLAVYYGEEAKYYALLLALVAALYPTLIAWLERGRPAALAGSVILLALAALCHYSSLLLFLLPPLIAPLFVGRRLRPWLSRGLAPPALAGLLAGIWYVLLPAGNAGGPGGALAWIGPYFRNAGPLIAPLLSLGAFVGAAFPGQMSAHGLTNDFPVLVSRCLLGAAIFIPALVAAWFAASRADGPEASDRRNRLAALALGLGVPLALLWLLSLVSIYFEDVLELPAPWPCLYVPGRYDLIAFPPFLLLAAAGFARLGARRWLRPPLAALLVLLAALGLHSFYLAPVHSPGREAARLLQGRVDRAGRNVPAIICWDQHLVVRYYLEREMDFRPLYFWPRSLETEPGWMPQALVPADALAEANALVGELDGDEVFTVLNLAGPPADGPHFPSLAPGQFAWIPRQYPTGDWDGVLVLIGPDWREERVLSEAFALLVQALLGAGYAPVIDEGTRERLERARLVVWQRGGE